MRIILEEKKPGAREFRRVEDAEKRDRSRARRDKAARRGPLAWA